MAFLFHRRLALPLWAMVFFMTVALTASPPATRFLTAVLGIGLVGLTIVVLMRSSRSVVPVVSQRHRHGKRRAGISVVAGACVRTIDDANGNTAEDALDLVRMDDDGGWQMPARPPA
jgi:hypothetical protein